MEYNPFTTMGNQVTDHQANKQSNQPVRKFFLMALLLAFIVSIMFSWLLVHKMEHLVEAALSMRPKANLNATAGRIGLDKLDETLNLTKEENESTQKKLMALIPDQNYLIVNTVGNDFRLMNKNQMIREGICSTGSYTVLKVDDKKQWTFKTPRGMFKVLNKVKDPVWKKPDWAFIEEGLKVPSANHPSRFEYGSLGDYALYLGQGYLIHGTLYKRYLGMPVTHGCVRMGDEDLEVVFKSLKIGSKVYIY
jgi:L,D-transpeptidase YbiS